MLGVPKGHPVAAHLLLRQEFIDRGINTIYRIQVK